MQQFSRHLQVRPKSGLQRSHFHYSCKNLKYNMSVCGGFGNAKEPTAEEQSILDHVKGEVEERLNKKLSTFKALKYTTQVVAGVNYIFKVKCDDQIAHVKVAKPLPHTNKAPFLMDVQTSNHTEDSPIEPF